MSIYDTINARADANKAAQWTAYRQETWWQDKDIWLDCGRNQSTTERAAYVAILHDLKFMTTTQHERFLDVLDIVREIQDEIRHTRTAVLIPLKEVLEKRGETLYWREYGLRPAAYVVPIVTVGT